jgi:hypothetical protein
LKNSTHVRPAPLIIQRVLVILIAVAMPLAARVRLPVVPAPAKTSVSVVIEIVITPPEVSLIKVTAVPIGNATLLLAGMVQVLAVVSAPG